MVLVMVEIVINVRIVQIVLVALTVIVTVMVIVIAILLAKIIKFGMATLIISINKKVIAIFIKQGMADGNIIALNYHSGINIKNDNKK